MFWRILRHTAALLIALLFLAFLVGTAYAHAGLQSAYPAPGETLYETPSQIRLTFTDPVSGGNIALYDSESKVLSTTLQDPSRSNEVVVTVDVPLEFGEYRVLWLATSVDGDPASGSYNFVIASREREYLRYGLIIVGLVLAITIVGGGGWWLYRRTYGPGEEYEEEAA